MKRKLAGLTSRCTTPCSWHAASARSMPRIIGAAVASEKGVQHSPTQFTPAALDELDESVLNSSSSSSFFGTTALSSSSVECATDAPESRSPPSQRSMSKCTPASSSNPSCKVTMSSDAPRAKCRDTSSRTLRSQMVIASPVGVCPARLCGPAFGMVLSANVHPSDLRVTARTTPMAPRPSGSPRMSAWSASRRRPRLNGSPST